MNDDHVKDQLFARIEELEKEKLELNEQLDALQKERGALQNRPDSCRNELQAQGKPYPKSGCTVCGNGGMAGCPYEARQPSTHLARLKAKWQADAVSEFAFHHLGGYEQEVAEIYASRLRRQAGGDA